MASSNILEVGPFKTKKESDGCYYITPKPGAGGSVSHESLVFTCVRYIELDLLHARIGGHPIVTQIPPGCCRL